MKSQPGMLKSGSRESTTFIPECHHHAKREGLDVLDATGSRTGNFSREDRAIELGKKRNVRNVKDRQLEQRAGARPHDFWVEDIDGVGGKPEGVEPERDRRANNGTDIGWILQAFAIESEELRLPKYRLLIPNRLMDNR